MWAARQQQMARLSHEARARIASAQQQQWEAAAAGLPVQHLPAGALANGIEAQLPSSLIRGMERFSGVGRPL